MEFSDSEFRRVKSAIDTVGLPPEVFMVKADAWADENHPEIQTRVDNEYQSKARNSGTGVEGVKIEAFGELVKRRVVKFAKFVNEGDSAQGASTQLSGPGGLNLE